jgi:multisubunit Na+/H+ antiporter MnhG subunit
MKTLALSSVVGAVFAAVIIYLIDFQNPASDVLIITLCVALSGSAGSMLTGRRVKRRDVKQRKV